jgi:hypothetical protein
MIGHPAMLIKLILLTSMCNSLHVGEIACLGICDVKNTMLRSEEGFI